MEELVRNVGQHGACTVLLKDSVESKGSFMVHYLLAKLLSQTSTRVVLLGLSDPYTHYNRIARKQGCNLQACRDKGRFVFLSLSPDVFDAATHAWNGNDAQQENMQSVANLLASLYSKVRDAARSMEPRGDGSGEQTCIIIDDVSVLDVVAGGPHDSVLDFVHYCQALQAGGKQRCSVVLLAHQDTYEADDSYAPLELEYVSNTVISVEPLSTGLAADVHGQMTIHNRSGRSHVQHSVPGLGIQKFQFRIMENGVQFFLPGQL
ncbi:unnamed protein product [Calypogeia fissa]